MLLSRRMVACLVHVLISDEPNVRIIDYCNRACSSLSLSVSLSVQHDVCTINCTALLTLK